MGDAGSNTSAFRHILKYSLIMAIAGSAFYTVVYLVEKPKLTWIYYIVMAVIAIFFIKNFRSRLEGGNITFARVFSLCFQSIFYAGVIYALYVFLFDNYLFPATYQRVLENTIKETRQGMLNSKLSVENIDASLEMSRKLMQNPGVEILNAILSFAFAGVIISLILAVIFKKEQVEADPV